MDVLSPLGQEFRTLRGGGRWKSLVAVAGGWGLLLGTRMVYPVVLPYLRDSFGLSLTVAGLLVTILWLGSAIGQLPGGLLADRFSERLVMTGGMVAVSAALVVVVVAQTPAVLFAATGLVGLGQSMYPIARITILSDVYPDRIGSALGVTMATGDLGQTVLPPVGGVLAAAIAWQAGLGFLIPLILLAAVGVYVVLPARPPSEDSAGSLTAERARLVLAELRKSNLVGVGFVLFLYIFIWQSFTGLYPTYLVEVKEMSSSAASVLFSSFFAFGIVAKPLAGAAYDRIGMRSALIIVFVGPVGGFAVLPFVDGFWSLAVVTAVVSSMLGSGAITQSFLSDSFSDEVRGTGLGVVRTVVSVLGASGPLVFGAIADRGFFDEGYLLLAVILAVALLVVIRLPRAS